MPWFSSSSPFDTDVERATDKNNTTENWALMMDLCDRVGNSSSNCKDCLRSIVKRLHSDVPHVQKQALTLLDACISNCGKPFHLEVASRDFEGEIRRLIQKGHPGIADLTRSLLKKWAENEFKSDPQLNLIPTLYMKFRQSGMPFDETKKGAKAVKGQVVASKKEEDDLLRAIELSLQETKQHSGGSSSMVDAAKMSAPTSLYPTAKIGASSTPVAKEPRKVRALYDFEAAEENELTFYTGEIIHVLDDSDANWWKGTNQRGEGLFPANFVTSDVSGSADDRESPSGSRKVQFREAVEVRTVDPEEEEEEEEEDETPSKPVQIDEDKMRMTLKLIHEGDPTGFRPDPPELAVLEGQCNAMGPLIDAELEKIDKKHAILSRLSTDLVDALNLYHTLMRSSYTSDGMIPGHPQPYMHPGMAPSPPVSVAPGQPPMPGVPPAPYGAHHGQPAPQPIYNPYVAVGHGYQMPAPMPHPGGVPEPMPGVHYPQQMMGQPPAHQMPSQPPQVSGPAPPPTSAAPNMAPHMPGTHAAPVMPQPYPMYHPQQYTTAPMVTTPQSPQHQAHPPQSMQHPQQPPAQPMSQAQQLPQQQQPQMHPMQAPYYGPQVAQPVYYPGYPPQHGYDPNKMAGMDQGQQQVYAPPMPGYDPNMMQRPPHSTGLEDGFASMNVNAGDGQAAQMNPVSHAAPGLQQPLL